MKILLGFVCAFSAFAQSAPSFEVASVKPNGGGERGMRISTPPGGGMTAQNVTLRLLIQFAYRVRAFQVTGGSSWVDSDRWDINAKGEVGVSREQVPEMTQALLAERFKLTLHRESRESPVYLLVAAKGGMKLPESKEGSCVTFNPNTPPPAPGQPPPNFCGNMRVGMDGFNAWKIGMKQFIMFLSDITGRTVIDKTGFTGTFDVHLEFVRDQATAGFGNLDGAAPPPADSNAPSIFTALQEQLGLKLDADKAPIEILVIDHAEKASEN